MSRRAPRIALLGGLGVLALALIAVGAWLVPALLAPAGPPIAPLSPLAGVVYADGSGAIQAWDAASGQSRVLVPAGPAERRLLDASADGGFVTYVEAAPPISGTETAPYRLQVWSAGAPVRTVPIPGGAVSNLTAQFFAGGDLAVLMHATSTRRGPLYAYDPAAGYLQPVAPQVDTYALGPGIVAYTVAVAVPGSDLPPRSPVRFPTPPPQAVRVLDLTTGDAAVSAVTMTVATGAPHPVQLYYEPTHNAFVYTAARPSGAEGRGTDLTLGMVPIGGPGGAHDLSLGTARADLIATLSPDGRYLLYGNTPPPPGIPGLVSAPQVAALTWLSASLQLTAHSPLTLSTGLQVRDAQFMRGRDWLVVSASHLIPRTEGGVSTPLLGAPLLVLLDPATGRQETVVDGGPNGGTARLLAVLDSHRLLVAASEGASGAPGLESLRLLLATRGLTGWQTQPLGGTLGANALLQFVGVLPSGDFVLWVDNRGGSPALYRVPSGGGAWQALVTLPGGRVFFPILQP